MCYCGKAWMSVTPPPPCPYHTRPAISISVAPFCRGRHCAHDVYCRGAVTFNG